jgi:hypothetical protein
MLKRGPVSDSVARSFLITVADVSRHYREITTRHL